MRRLALLIAFLLAAAPARAADAYASDWVKGLQSSARLIAAGGEQAGPLRAGVEITLEGKSVTYWRAPGEAGVPPVFHFSASRNLGKIDVLYPAPQRIEENGAEIFGYQRGVIFPLHVTPLNKALPVMLDLMLDYAACDRICVPAQAHLTLALPAASRIRISYVVPPILNGSRASYVSPRESISPFPFTSISRNIPD